jgi:hypothetical protein
VWHPAALFPFFLDCIDGTGNAHLDGSKLKPYASVAPGNIVPIFLGLENLSFVQLKSSSAEIVHIPEGCTYVLQLWMRGSTYTT